MTFLTQSPMFACAVATWTLKESLIRSQVRTHQRLHQKYVALFVALPVLLLLSVQPYMLVRFLAKVLSYLAVPPPLGPRRQSCWQPAVGAQRVPLLAHPSYAVAWPATLPSPQRFLLIESGKWLLASPYICSCVGGSFPITFCLTMSCHAFPRSSRFDNLFGSFDILHTQPSNRI
eukprot:4232063-Amphidinium_carterae.1